MQHDANKWVKRNTTHDTDTENSYKRRRLTDSLREQAEQQMRQQSERRKMASGERP